MMRWSAAAVGLIVVLAGGLYVAGYRVAVDGTGYRPRFVTRQHFDTLEAQRAAQKRAFDTLEVSPEAGLRASAAAGPTGGATIQGRPPAVGPPGHAAAAGGLTAGDLAWPSFRGVDRDGRYRAEPIRTDWPSAGLPLLWRQPVGLGYASFTVAGGRAFTIEQRRDREVVAGYDLRTGRELWIHDWPGSFVETMGGDGPRATPTYDDGRVYALGALGELRSLDAATGRLYWRRNILEDAGARNLSWGMAASPLIVDGRVVVLPGGSGGRSVMAYDVDTGELAWSAGDDPQAYVSPMLVTLAGVRQLLVVSARRVMGLTPDGGKRLWDYPWATSQGINVAQPLVLGGDRVFVSASYGQGAAVFEVHRSGTGFDVHTVWENNRMKNKFTSSVLHEGYIYGLDESILACLDAATGELQWKGGRYGYGQLLLAGDHLVVISESGELVLVEATPEGHHEAAAFQAIEGKTWNHPVIAEGTLLVRNLREMAAFDIRP